MDRKRNHDMYIDIDRHKQTRRKKKEKKCKVNKAGADTYILLHTCTEREREIAVHAKEDQQTKTYTKQPGKDVARPAPSLPQLW